MYRFPEGKPVSSNRQMSISGATGVTSTFHSSSTIESLQEQIKQVDPAFEKFNDNL